MYKVLIPGLTASKIDQDLPQMHVMLAYNLPLGTGVRIRGLRFDVDIGGQHNPLFE
jgi:hypothetical protein